MGYIKKEYVIVDYFEFKNDKKPILKMIKKFIRELEPQFKRLFYVNEKMVNGSITIFMNWDGSKEGWDHSNEADSYRKELLDMVKKTDSKVFYVCDDEAKEFPYMECKEYDAK